MSAIAESTSYALYLFDLGFKPFGQGVGDSVLCVCDDSINGSNVTVSKVTMWESTMSLWGRQLH